jgi:hypothetical protein
MEQQRHLDLGGDGSVINLSSDPRFNLSSIPAGWKTVWNISS